MSPDRQRSKKGEGEHLRDELLDAAEELLSEAGSTDAVSIRAITEAVGVTAPALYLHFADKDELFFEVCQRRFAAFGAAMLGSLEGVEDPAAQARALGRAYIEYAFANPEQYATLFDIPLPPAVAEDPSELPGWQALQVLVEVVRAGIAAGQFREDVDPEHAAIGLWSLVHGYVHVTRHLEDDLGGAMAPRDALDAVLDLGLVGLAVRP